MSNPMTREQLLREIAANRFFTMKSKFKGTKEYSKFLVVCKTADDQVTLAGFMFSDDAEEFCELRRRKFIQEQLSEEQK